MHTLVTTASKHGATAEIGLLIGDVLNEAGIRTTVRPADTVTDLDGYDAVVLGSAIYMGRWLAPTRELVERLPEALSSRDVWLFSSGPLGDPPVPAVEPPEALEALSTIPAREHRLFAGRLVRSKLGFGERTVVKVVRAPDGDFIPREEVRAWASTIARSLLEKLPSAPACAVSGM